MDSWLLLLHQIPPKPAYFRAKVLRRLNQVGALAIKKSAYVMPASEDTQEDLEWILREIVEEGGEGWILRSELVAGHSDESLRAAFGTVRAADYAELIERTRALLEAVRRGPGDGHEAEWQRLLARLDEIRRIDFFKAANQHEAETLMSEIERSLRGRAGQAEPKSTKGGQLDPRELKGRTWVTRKGVKVDRIASAWLIRRMIDPAARFSFVDAKGYRPSADEVRFDMFDGEFTHEGDQCTFEVLVARAKLKDPALRAIAEVVHDIDFKDGKFGRAEAAGVAPVIDGIVLRHEDDTRRLEEGATLLDALHAKFKAGGRGGRRTT
jgi:hypothetical protein